MIKRVQGDGLCIRYAFVEGIFHLREVHKSITKSAKNPHYSVDTEDIMAEFERNKNDAKCWVVNLSNEENLCKKPL